MSIKIAISRALQLRREYVERGVQERQAERLATEEAAAESSDFAANVIRTFLERSEEVGEARALEDTKALYSPARVSLPPSKRSLVDDLEAGHGGFAAMSTCIACGSEWATDDIDDGLCPECLAWGESEWDAAKRRGGA